MKQSSRHSAPIISIIILAVSLSLVAAYENITIECNFQLSDGWHQIFDELYTCEIASISPTDIVQPNSIITAIIGTHIDGKLNQNVQAIRAKNLNIHYLPQGLHKFFPNLLAVSILSSQLKEVRQSDLQPFPHLKYLNLYDNHLRSIRMNLFEHNEKIELIGLHYNDVKNFDAKIIENLKNLRYLWLEELNEDRV